MNKLAFPKPLHKKKVKKFLPKTKKTTLGKAKKKAWDAFSLWVRMRNVTNQNMGFVNCYTCEKSYHYKNMNAGHGIGGRNNAVLFDEAIVRPQCVGCNIWGRGQYQVFTRKLIGELGLEAYDEIVKHSSDPVKYKVADYEEIEQRYKRKLEEL